MTNRNYVREKIGAKLFDLIQEAQAKSFTAGYTHAEFGGANTTVEAYNDADIALDKVYAEIIKKKKVSKEG